MISLVAASMLLASAPSADNRPATPINRTAPDFPASCMPKQGEAMAPQKVVVVYTVTSKGTVEGARVRETTNACFNEAAIAAVRGWRFEPAKSKGVTIAQEDIETTFNFVLGESTRSQDFDASPVLRVPPRYPEICMDNAENKETVYVEFDVTAEGRTENIRVFDSTNSCLNASAVAAVKKWKYRPKIEDGKPVARTGVQTAVTYELFSSSTPAPYRREVGRRLNRAAADLRHNKDPQEVLADLADIEQKYGSDFTREELAAFHQMRGAARLGAQDYRGALDDFRIAQRNGVSQESAKAIAEVIAKLEAYVAAEDAGALPQAEAAPPAPPESEAAPDAASAGSSSVPGEAEQPSE